MPNAITVVLNCAGMGTRLGLDRTKALLDINGRSLISYQLEALKHIDDVRVVVGFQAELLIEEVLRYRENTIFVFNHDYMNTNVAQSFNKGSEYSSDLVMCWDGDLLVHPDDISACLKMDSEFIGYSDRKSENSIDCVINSDGFVKNFSVDHLSRYEWSGLCLLNQKTIKQYTREEFVYQIIQKSLPKQGKYIRSRDIDTYQDYLNAVAFVKGW